MPTYEEYEKLEREEFELTQGHIIIMLYLLSGVHANIERELRSVYQQYGKDGVITYGEMMRWISSKDKRKRYTALTVALTNEFTGLKVQLEQQFLTMLERVIIKEQSFFGVSVDISKVLYKSWGIDDLYWLERLENDILMWNAYIQNDVKRAFLQRKHIDDVIDQLTKRFNTIQNTIEVLGITESTATTSITRQQIFKEMGATHYRFCTKEDERTCEVCGSMHNQIFPLSAYEVGVTASPLHPRCRCWEEPIVE